MSAVDVLAVFDHLAAGRSMTIGELAMTRGRVAELLEALAEFGGMDDPTAAPSATPRLARLRAAYANCRGAK
ncbi:MAG: hypothetical protein ACOH2M_27170 [Cypionkella sp.]